MTPLSDVQEALRSEPAAGLETARATRANDLVAQWREAATVETMLDQITTIPLMPGRCEGTADDTRQKHPEFFDRVGACAGPVAR